MSATMPFLPAENNIVSGNVKERAKSVIYVFLPGGFSQYDSFDIEKNKETLGKTEAQESNVDGIRVSQYFPNMAKQMDKVAVLSAMKTNQGAHPAGIYKALTGYNPRSSITHPEVGAWISRYKSKKEDTLPNFVAVSSNRSGTSGFLPGMYAALPVKDPNKGIRYSSRQNGVDATKFDKRMKMLSQFNNQFQRHYGTGESKAYMDVYNSSINFMKSKDIEAFDLKKENKNISKLYAKDKFSQGCLLAGRLVEKGVRFTKVELGGWDYHKSIYTDFPGKAAILDKGLSSLLKHLTQKGLLDSTLVVVGTEFGRSPSINANHGRDHHPKGFTCLLAGAGVKAGEIHGKTAKDGKDIIDGAIDITDFNATIAWAMGVNPNKEMMSSSGRPFTIANKGKVRSELFS